MNDEHEAVSRAQKTLIGRKVIAEYREAVLPLHCGNPFIEALPPFRDTAAVMEVLNLGQPTYDVSIRSESALVRRQFVDTLSQVFVLLPRHFRLEEAVMDSIRNSYAYRRNPVLPATLEGEVAKAGAIDVDNPDFDEPAIGASGVFGMAGTGKTRSVKRTLVRGCPQVIEHREYRGNHLGRLQLCWIVTTCPHDATVKSMCADATDAADRVLGTHYGIYVRKGKTEREMMTRLCRVLAIHGVGLWVIDEIQNICVARSVERKRLSRFLVALQEQMSARLMLVGTPEVREEIMGDLPLLRRSLGENGPIEWDRLRPGAEWDRFLAGIWRYQYTREETVLTDGLNRAMWELSLGIPDVAVKLYRMAQREIIGHKGALSERIDVELLSMVAETRMGFVHTFLQSMRSNPEAVKKWDHPKTQKQIEENAAAAISHSKPTEETEAQQAATIVSSEKSRLDESHLASAGRPILNLRDLATRKSA